MLDFDPLERDQALSRAAEAWRRWRRRLRAGSGLDEDPFAVHRPILSKTAFDELAGLPADDPLRAPLRAWTYRLAEQRINHAALVAVAAAERQQQRVIDAPEHAQLTLAELRRRALSDDARRRSWTSAWLSHANDHAAAVTRLWERRREVATRMGLASPDELEAPCAGMRDVAEAWLARTDDAFDAHRARELAELIRPNLGLDCADGWPARLDLRTLAEVVGGDLLHSVSLDPDPLPRAFGPASFVRGLHVLGAAWSRALAPRHQPFAIANDPYGLRERSDAALFAGLPLSGTFLRRRLGFGARGLRDAQRMLARVMLTETRAAALRVCLGRAALEGSARFREAFEDGMPRALGPEIEGRLAGAVLTPHVGDAQTLAGQLLAARRAMELVETYDEDFIENPRAHEQLRAEAALSPTTRVEPDALNAGAQALYAQLAERL